jgi:phosphopantetheine adenylyltransferase
MTDWIKKNKSKYPNISIIRGLRNNFDLQAEINLLRVYQDLMPEISVIHIICDREVEHVSSTTIRELKSSGGDVKKYILS